MCEKQIKIGPLAVRKIIVSWHVESKNSEIEEKCLMVCRSKYRTLFPTAFLLCFFFFFMCQTNKQESFGEKNTVFYNFRSLLSTQNHFDRFFLEYNDSDTLKIPTVFLIDCRSQSTLNEHLTELHEVQHQARKSGCCWKFNASNGNLFSYACMKDPRWNWSKQMETQAA